MIIDGNKKEKEALEAFRLGNNAQGHRLQDEFVAEVRESLKTEDHCPCITQCKYHGKCLECVAIHRAHKDHLPYCLWDMVNDRIAAVSQLTEHSVVGVLQHQ